jgi:hypothetical protein
VEPPMFRVVRVATSVNALVSARAKCPKTCETSKGKLERLGAGLGIQPEEAGARPARRPSFQDWSMRHTDDSRQGYRNRITLLPCYLHLT